MLHGVGPDQESGSLPARVPRASGPQPLSVLMVAGATRDGEQLRCQHLISEQARSLQSPDLRISLHGVDDRRTLSGIWRNIRTLRKAVSLQSPDIIHVQYGSVLALIGLLSGHATPLVISFCGSDLLGLTGSSIRCRTRNALTRAAGLIAAVRARAITVKSQNLWQSLPPFLREKACVVPNGVDTDLFVPVPAESCRVRLGWPRTSKIVLFDAGRGRGQATKNIELARAAISSLRERFPDVELKVISDASREDVVLMLNAADCLLVTSLHEGSPNIVKEAMACNLPVVSVPCGDVQERLDGASVGGVYPRDVLGLDLGVGRVLTAGARSNGHEELLRQGMTARSIRDRLLEVYVSVSDRSDIGAASPEARR